MTSTFPQWQGDPRGGFIQRLWEARAAAGESVEVLAPRTRWCTGEIGGPLTVTRFAYAPASCSTLSGQFGILENIRARPYRAALLPPFLASMHRAIRARLAAANFDRLVAHMIVPCGIAGALATTTGLRLEIFGHGTDVDVLIGAPRPVRRWAVRRLQRASAIFLPSQEKLGRFVAALPELRPACSVATMVETVVDERVQRCPVPGRILFLGRLIRQKGVDDLIRAVAQMDGAAHLHIAGDGPERGRLAALAERTGARVVFHGFVEGSRKRAALASASVVCVPSREVAGLSEGTPLVVREAGLHRIPVVATRVGGIPELVGTDDDVTLVPPGDPGALRRALARHVQS